MGIEEHARRLIEGALADLARDGVLPPAVIGAAFVVERPKRAEHGDVATNAPLALQKLAQKAPRAVAELLAEPLRRGDGVREVTIAGAGFLNLRFTPAPFHAVLRDVLAAGAGYGRAAAATGERVLLEFVSANPTGPLLISHGRGAVLGDAVGTLLEAVGHRVTREYYVNDFGNQVRLLGESVRAALEGRPTPEGGYGADYVKELAAWLGENARDAVADADPQALARAAVTRMLDGVPGSKGLPGIKRTLGGIGVRHDVWFSEESLHRWGRVSAALIELGRRGYLEEREGALFFKSESEGDDKDRVVRKSDGLYTYFASDIAYHADKMARGYDRLIDVLGADHHGYQARVRGAMKALDFPAGKLEVLLYQLVNLLRDGVPYKMGKRLGNLITIEEVVDEIDEGAQRAGAGADALRYFYLSRRSDTTIDLDLEVAKKASFDNPVFYLQYGYARACSMLARAEATFHVDTARLRPTPELLARLDQDDELSILATLGRFPGVLAESAALREPHRIVFYLQELSQAFQSYFTRRKDDPVLPQAKQTREPGWEARWDWEKTRARLLWIEAIRAVYGASLRLLGISAPPRLVRPEGGAGDRIDGDRAGAVEATEDDEEAGS
jgi:arginyl-tRNA synthetase